MNPAEVIKFIENGNEDFLNARGPDYFRSHRERQTPLITLLTCSDSRVQSSAILPDPVNNIFTVENIGNQIATSEGSLDYGILHLKTPVLLIAGHSDCGAIKAYSAGYSDEPASIQMELDQLYPVFSGGEHDARILSRTIQNIQYQTEMAMEKYSKQVEAGELLIAGAYYDFTNDFKRGYGKLVMLSLNGQEQEF
jgi:carbonic anhydrase